MEQLFINQKLMELEDRAVALSLQINDFRELKDRQANYSNSIKIPKTTNNEKVLELLGFNGSSTRIPYENVSVKYILNGIEIISNGKGVVKNTNGFFNLVIYDGNISITDLLGSSTLKDLPLTSYNHHLSVNSFLSSSSNTSGYTYAFSGNVPTTIGNTVTLFYIHTLFDLVFSNIGWIASGDIFSNENYKSRVMTMDFGSNDATYTEVVSIVYNSIHGSLRKASYPTPQPVITYVSDSYTVLAEGYYRLYFSGSINVLLGDVNLQYEKNGVALGTTDIINPITDEFYLYANAGDVIVMKYLIFTETVGTFPNETFEYDFTENFTTFISLDESYKEVVISEMIGEMKQIDFIKDVMQRFNLSFRTKRNTSELEFITSEALLSNVADAENWSDKFSGKLNESYTSSYSQDNIFKYKYDESDSTFADGNLLVSNKNLTVLKTSLTSIFKATIFLGNKYQLKYWELNSETGIQEPIQGGYRIFKIRKEIVEVSFRLNTLDENFAITTLNASFLDFTNLSYQKELDDNYPTFNALLNDYKIVTVEMNLNIIDVYNIDFFKLKYISQLGRSYYLNKIVNFRNDKKTKVELIQIPI